MRQQGSAKLKSEDLPLSPRFLSGVYTAAKPSDELGGRTGFRSAVKGCKAANEALSWSFRAVGAEQGAEGKRQPSSSCQDPAELTQSLHYSS